MTEDHILKFYGTNAQGREVCYSYIPEGCESEGAIAHRAANKFFDLDPTCKVEKLLSVRYKEGNDEPIIRDYTNGSNLLVRVNLMLLDMVREEMGLPANGVKG